MNVTSAFNTLVTNSVVCGEFNMMIFNEYMYRVTCYVYIQKCVTSKKRFLL